MKPKKGDTVELLRCYNHLDPELKGETGVVKRVYFSWFIALTKPASCGCKGFTSNEYKIISKKEVKMGRKYEFSKDGLRIGDIVANKDGYKIKVLEVLENTFATSLWDDFNNGIYWFQFRNAIKNKWTIEQPVKPKSKATLKKIAEAKKRKAQLKREQAMVDKYLKEQGELCE